MGDVNRGLLLFSRQKKKMSKKIVYVKKSSIILLLEMDRFGFQFLNFSLLLNFVSSSFLISKLFNSFN